MIELRITKITFEQILTIDERDYSVSLTRYPNNKVAHIAIFNQEDDEEIYVGPAEYNTWQLIAMSKINAFEMGDSNG